MQTATSSEICLQPIDAQFLAKEKVFRAGRYWNVGSKVINAGTKYQWNTSGQIKAREINR